MLCHNLFLMDGIELNRPEIRKKFGIKTKYRALGTNYGKYDNKFIAEYEEVVVSCDSFSYQDFLEIRNLNFMYYAVFSLNFQKWFFQFLRTLNIKLSDFFVRFVKPDRNQDWPKGYLEFIDNLNNAIENELHDTKEDVVSSLKKIYKENNDDVGEPSRINVSIGSKLIYQEKDWIEEVLLKHLDNIMENKTTKENRNLAQLLIDLGKHERINLKDMTEKKTMNFSYDVISWKEGKFKQPLTNFKMNTKPINFIIDDLRITQVENFNKRFKSNKSDDFYYAAMDFITPRSCLMYILSYDN